MSMDKIIPYEEWRAKQIVNLPDQARKDMEDFGIDPDKAIEDILQLDYNEYVKCRGSTNDRN